MNTLLLDTIAWDLCLDASGNIAMASNPYSLAQDAASAVRLFQGELWYNTAPGVPYWSSILGKFPPLSLIRAKQVAAALTVPEVTSANCYYSSFTNRELQGQVQVTDKTGITAGASIA